MGQRANLDVLEGTENTRPRRNTKRGRQGRSLDTKPTARFSSRKLKLRRLQTYRQMVVANIRAVLFPILCQFGRYVF